MVFNFNSDGIQYSSGGEEINNEDITVTSNGTYTAGEGYTGLGTVDVNVADIPATTEELNVTPTTSAQTIRPPQGLDGYNPVNVAAVTSAIDQNINADNIKSGVNILGTTGTYTGEVEDLTSEIIAGDTVDVTDLQDVEADIAAIIPRTLSMTKTITENGTYNAIDDGSNGYSSVTVAVDGEVEDLTSDIINGESVDTSDLETYEEDIAGIIPRAISMTKTITENGTYTALDDGADGYSEVTVNVAGSGGVGIPREVVNGTLNFPVTSFTYSLPSDVTDIAENVLKSALMNLTSLTEVDLSSLTTLSGNSACYQICTGCTNLTDVDLSSLTTISGGTAFNEAFKDCTSLSNVDLSSLTTISGSTSCQRIFNNCTSLTSIDLSNLTSIAYYSLYEAFKGCTNLVSVNLSSLSTLNTYALQYAFNGCTSLTDVDLSSLTTISNEKAMAYTFQNCTGLTSIDLSSLTTLNAAYPLQYAFRNCTNLTSVDLSGLTTISGTNPCEGAFNGCTSLANINLSGLTTINSSNTFRYTFYNTALTSVTFDSLNSLGSYALQGAFRDCPSLTTLSFPSLTSTSFGAYTNQFSSMLLNVTGCTVHFPSNLQSILEDWMDVQSGFDGTNTTILFDLPATT